MIAWGRFLVGKLNIHIETFSCSIASVELITVTGFYCITLIEAACQDEVQVICIAHYEKVVGIAASQQPCWLLCRWHDYNSYSVWVWCTVIIIVRKLTDVKIIITFLMNYYYSVPMKLTLFHCVYYHSAEDLSWLAVLVAISWQRLWWVSSMLLAAH